MRVAFAALSEMHDQQRMLDRLEREGFKVWRGDREDSEANPVLWDPQQVKVTERITKHLLDAGKRGGKYNMAKSLVGIKGVHLASQRQFIGASRHQIQTVNHPDREGAARRFNTNTVAALRHRKVAMFIGGDDNAEFHNPTLDPMRNAGWRSIQDIGRKIDTHKMPDPKRAIDTFWFMDRSADPGVVRFKDKWGKPFKSDHLALYGEWTLDRRNAPGRAPLVMVVVNRGDRADFDDIMGLLEYRRAA